MAAQGRAAVGHQADARPHHTSRSVHPRQCGVDDNQIDQDELFDFHINNNWWRLSSDNLRPWACWRRRLKPPSTTRRLVFAC
ncbi:hypothetical protein MRB56_13915 [Halomonas cupida]|uniref:hypothetical protein n=1 Tax=Halomonas cupida TaxID=44933 RepID=UPI0039B53F28